ncbi:MAG: SCP2 sterol-binding domain-containing protein [Phototrophicaceae bacterium]
MQAFSQEWATAYHQAINADQAYATSGAKWSLGKLALVLDEQAVLLDLDQGQCHSVNSMHASEARTDAAYIIEGNAAVWQDVLSGKVAPLMGIMSGKLKLTKGSIGSLMPFAKAAVDLVDSAKKLDTQF